MNPIRTGSYTVTPAQATGTITVVDYLNPDESAVAATGSFLLLTDVGLQFKGIIINSTPFLCQFNVTYGVDVATTVANFVSSINANSSVNTLVTAVQDIPNPAICHITANTAGVSGNAITIATNYATAFQMSGTTLTGGADAGAKAVIIINGNTLTQDTDFTFATSNNASATSIKNAINGITNLTGVRATSNNAVVTMIANVVGIAGDLYTVTTNELDAIVIDDIHLNGGSRGDAGTLGVSKSVTGLCLTTHATGACRINLYDDGNVSGNLLFTLDVDAGTSQFFQFGVGFGVGAKAGFFVDLIPADVTKIPTLLTVDYVRI